MSFRSWGEREVTLTIGNHNVQFCSLHSTTSGPLSADRSISTPWEGRVEQLALHQFVEPNFDASQIGTRRGQLIQGNKG